MARIQLSKRKGSISTQVGTTGIVPSASGIKDKAVVGLADTAVQIGGAYAEKFAIAKANTENIDAMNELKLIAQQEENDATIKYAGTDHGGYRDDVYNRVKARLDERANTMNLSSKGKDLVKSNQNKFMGQLYNSLDITGRSRGIEYFEAHDAESRITSKRSSGTSFKAAADSYQEDLRSRNTSIQTFHTQDSLNAISGKDHQYATEVIHNKFIEGGAHLVDLQRFLNNEKLTEEESEMYSLLSAKQIDSYKNRLKSKLNSANSSHKKLTFATTKGAIAIAEDEFDNTHKFTLQAKEGFESAMTGLEAMDPSDPEVIQHKKSLKNAAVSMQFKEGLVHLTETQAREFTREDISGLVPTSLVTGVQDTATIKSMDQARKSYISRAVKDYASIHSVNRPDLVPGTKQFYESQKPNTSFPKYLSRKAMDIEIGKLRIAPKGGRLEALEEFTKEYPDTATPILAQIVDGPNGSDAIPFLIASQFKNRNTRDMFLRRGDLTSIKQEAGGESDFREIETKVREAMPSVLASLGDNDMLRSTIVSAAAEDAFKASRSSGLSIDEGILSATNKIKDEYIVSTFEHNNILLTAKDIGDSSLVEDLSQVMEILSDSRDGEYLSQLTGASGKINGYEGFDGRDLDHDFWHAIDGKVSFKLNDSRTGVQMLFFNPRAKGGARQTLLNISDSDGNKVPLTIFFDDIKQSKGKWQEAIVRERQQQTPRATAQRNVDFRLRKANMTVKEADLRFRGPLIKATSFLKEAPEQPSPDWKIKAQENVDFILTKAGLLVEEGTKRNTIQEEGRKLAKLMGQSVFPKGWKKKAQEHVDNIINKAGLEK